ncbi:fibronectin type III domain-containing protein [Streptomyces sp. GbtcB7]|uniref:fibronectin type III domain-containing protein n=1 Tax=Streptomyces sp. GbtcB7 TaxID=2824752 RepID=UPI001C2FC4FC|nr:fibronectin type III domain-containing protein [Streptomyces sp. GbtcB7]
MSCVVTFAPAAAALPGRATTSAGQASAGPEGRLDEVTFGDESSEKAHAFSGAATEVVDGAAGDAARVAQPSSPAGEHLGDLTFTVAVDPQRQNYLSLRFWGEDVSSYRTVLYVNGEQANYRNGGDYEPVNNGTAKGLEGRFFYSTAMLPLASTQGHKKVEIIVRTFPGSLTALATEKSRRYYQAVTHTSPKLTLPLEDNTGYDITTKSAPALSKEKEQEKIDSFRKTQVDLFNSLSAKADADAKSVMSIERYKDDLRFYAETLLTDWSPAKTAEEKRAALECIFQTIDNQTKNYYGNVKSLGNGGHQSDWGGYYGALGEALYVVENLIDDNDVYGRKKFQEFLDQPFSTGTKAGENSLADADWKGGELTRGEAWERVLKANFDFARSRLSYIYNQVMYTYEGAWKAHEGLRVIGSGFFEGKDRSHAIAGESLGSRPFLGEEVLLGPDGKKLNLYHSLFQHDGNAVYTDDYLQIVMKGLAKSQLDNRGNVVRRKPYGEHYTGITAAGLTRENGYVGGYGESANYLTSWFFRTLDHRGDEALNDEILKLALRNVHARGETRYQGSDTDGNRAMFMEQVVDDRNNGYPGKMSYAVDNGTGRGLTYASLEQYMADHEKRYDGKAWQPYWNYARQAVGYIQQQLVDNQYFPYFDTVLANHRYDLRLPDNYAYVTHERGSYKRFGKTPAGTVLPHTDLDRYTDEELKRLGVDRTKQDTRFAWADIDNLLVSVRDGDTHLLANLFERNKGYLGNGRIHAQYGTYEQLVQVQTQGVFASQDYFPRAASAEDPMVFDRYTTPDRPLAMGGELLPVTYQPGVGTVARDNFLYDTPYSGYPDLLTSRYGKYLMAVNTTRKAYGNERTHQVKLPAGFSGRSVTDLVSGKNLPVSGGRVSVPPFRAVVLKLDSETVRADVPSAVNVAVTTAGARHVGLSWSPAAGASSYTVTRADTAKGPYRTVAKGAKSTSYVDRVSPTKGEDDYFYRVLPVNAQGTGQASNPAKAHATPAATAALRKTEWRDDAIGGAKAGTSSVRGDTITVRDARGDGFGGGDDSVMVDRDHTDSYTQISQVAKGGVEVSAKLAPTGDGTLRGVILRDSTDAKARYVYLGANAKGELELRHRSLDTRADIGTGVPGSNAGGGITRSPYTQQLEGYTAKTHPYVKLVRLPKSTDVLAMISTDGKHWQRAGKASVPMIDVVHVGVAADSAATFGEVTIRPFSDDAVIASGTFGGQTGTLTWTKPKAAIAFDVYRTPDVARSVTDPRREDGWQKVLSDRYALTLKDNLYGGRMYYKVVARTVEGTTSVSAEPAVITADSLATVLQQTEALVEEDYTAASYAAFTAEVDSVRKDSGEPGADESALIKRVYEAYELLRKVYRDSFETSDPDVWQKAGSGPYEVAIDPQTGRTGNRSLYFASTDTSQNGFYNLSFNSRGKGTSPISTKPGTLYKVSFWYQLKDYGPGPGLGAYYFISSRNAGNQVGTEQRNWLPKGNTPSGTWKLFERVYRTEAGSVDNVAIDFGLRGSYGQFRVDDLRVEPVG